MCRLDCGCTENEIKEWGCSGTHTPLVYLPVHADMCPVQTRVLILAGDTCQVQLHIRREPGVALALRPEGRAARGRGRPLARPARLRRDRDQGHLVGTDRPADAVAAGPPYAVAVATAAAAAVPSLQVLRRALAAAHQAVRQVLGRGGLGGRRPNEGGRGLAVGLGAGALGVLQLGPTPIRPIPPPHALTPRALRSLDGLGQPASHAHAVRIEHWEAEWYRAAGVTGGGPGAGAAPAGGSTRHKDRASQPMMTRATFERRVVPVVSRKCVLC